MNNSFNNGYIISNDGNLLMATALQESFICIGLLPQMQLIVGQATIPAYESDAPEKILFVFLLDEQYETFFKIACQVRQQWPDATIVCIDLAVVNAIILNKFLTLNKCVITSGHNSLSELVFLIRELEHKNLSISRDVLERLVIENLRQRDQKHERFTKMEKLIIEAAKNGLTIAQTAAKLKISSFTVVNHRSNIFKKTGVNSVIQLVSRLGKAY